MLQYINENHDLYEFNDLNPSIIGHKIRWIKANPEGYIDGHQGLYLTVSSYEERSKEVHYLDRFELTRTEIRMRTFDGDTVTVKPEDKFTTNFKRYLTGSERFSPTMSLGEYTYDAVGAEIVGNSIMVTTGQNSNHSWGDFITGRVISYKTSGAVSYNLMHRDSVLYEVEIEGVDRPIVVDSYSSFWA